MSLIRRGELLLYKDDFYLWSYVPSMAAAAIFTAVFFLLSLAHTWKIFRHRMWFCLPFVIGGYMEVVGFAGRIAAHDATDELMPYIIQSVFTLIPPSLFAASIYMTLGRIMRGLGPAESHTFVVGDAFAFLIQSSGAGLMAAGDDQKLGEVVVIVGLVVQIVFFSLFVTAAVVFERRYTRSTIQNLPYGGFDWKGMLAMLYSTSALILARCLFRIIEYSMGSDAYLLENEWTLYIFDALLMATTMVIFYYWYPSKIPHVNDRPDSEHIALNSQESR